MVEASVQRIIAHLQEASSDVLATSPRVREALDIAKEAYGDEMHWSGETVFEHVAGVLETLMPFHPDEDAVIACILHHILSSEGWTLLELEQRFGTKVRSLVSGVHLLSHVTVRGRRGSIEDLRIMLLTVSDDVRTVLISLCDRSYLLKFIHRLDADDQRRICQDVLSVFAPVAARLGIYTMKHQLESAAFPVLYANDAERIQEQYQQLDNEHGNFFTNSASILEQNLAEHGITARVQSRQKQPYSIFAKMRTKSLSHIEDIHDLYALRVIVGSVEQCYQVLGLLHRMARPVPNRFKDYISFPKPNGYQSLHSTLMQLPGTPDDCMVEVQIRTEEMDREAKYGIAAHWSYKEYGSTTLALENAQLHQMLASQEALESDTGQNFVDHIFVLTPNGDVIELPEGANPLDFAFQVHTELGLRFRGARVNGAMVAIDHQLDNGDVVEVMKSATPNPSDSWMQILNVSSARSKLRRYLYSQDRPQLVSRGKQLLNEALEKRKFPRLDNDFSVLRDFDGKRLTSSQREDILMKIGQGAERAASVVERIDMYKQEMQSTPTKEKKVPSGIPADGAVNVQLAGGVPMPMRFAQCCKPNTNKSGSIIGVVNRFGIVVIHNSTCGMLRHANPERKIGAKWSIKKASSQ